MGGSLVGLLGALPGVSLGGSASWGVGQAVRVDRQGEAPTTPMGTDRQTDRQTAYRQKDKHTNREITNLDPDPTRAGVKEAARHSLALVFIYTY